jgi:hypothetical protein
VRASHNSIVPAEFNLGDIVRIHFAGSLVRSLKIFLARISLISRCRGTGCDRPVLDCDKCRDAHPADENASGPLQFGDQVPTLHTISISSSFLIPGISSWLKVWNRSRR